MSIPVMRIFGPLLLLGGVLALSACASPSSVSGPRLAAGADAGSASVVFVVVAEGVEDELPRSRLHALLERSFDGDDRVAPVPAAMVAVALGEARFERIGDEVARYGVLSTEARRDLLAMPIPVSRALLVRLERNGTEVLEPRTEPLFGTDGEPLVDRRAVLLSRQRHVRIAASLLDLPSGERVWQQAWQAEPVASLRYVDYTGSSLAASVAVTLSNTVVSGLDGPSAPPAIDAERAISALFDTLAEELSAR